MQQIQLQRSVKISLHAWLTAAAIRHPQVISELFCVTQELSIERYDAT